MLVDVHSHLNDSRLISNVEEIIEKSRQNGVEKIICSGHDLSSSVLAIQLANKYDNVFASIGIHPHSCFEYDENFEELAKTAIKNRKIVAIGEIGLDFYKHFKNSGITRVFTIESSGISPALTTAYELNVPMVILKKQTSKILDDDFYQTEVKSFTKNNVYNLTLSKKYIEKDDNILIIDDFLANGEAAKGAIRLVESTGAKVAGIGIVIEKSFQPGHKYLQDLGYDIYSLARIKSLENGQIEFID